METFNVEMLEDGLRQANSKNTMYDYLTKEIKLSGEEATELEFTFHDAVKNPNKYTTLSPEYTGEKDDLSLAILYISESIIRMKEATKASLGNLKDDLDA